MANMTFLEKFIPSFEFAALREHLQGEERDHFEDLLCRAEAQIRSMPRIGETDELSAEGITVRMHYFWGNTDYWLYELDPEEMYAFGFVCLNGWTDMAELGEVYLPEIFSAIPFIEFDLYWHDKSLEEIMNSIKQN